MDGRPVIAIRSVSRLVGRSPAATSRLESMVNGVKCVYMNIIAQRTHTERTEGEPSQFRSNKEHIAAALTPYMRNAAAAGAIQLLRNTFLANLDPLPLSQSVKVSHRPEPPPPLSVI